MDLKVGDPMTRGTLDSALKGLFATGLFADVTLTQEGSALVVDVLENPVINQIAFEGNEKIENQARFYPNTDAPTAGVYAYACPIRCIATVSGLPP